MLLSPNFDTNVLSHFFSFFCLTNFYHFSRLNYLYRLNWQRRKITQRQVLQYSIKQCLQSQWLAVNVVPQDPVDTKDWNLKKAESNDPKNIRKIHFENFSTYRRSRIVLKYINYWFYLIFIPISYLITMKMIKCVLNQIQ